MLKRILIICLVALPLTIFAQENNGYFGNEPFLDGDSTALKSNISNPIKSNKLKAGFTAGSMYTNYNGNSVFSNYAAPEIRYNFTDKFSLSAGTMMTYTSVPSFIQWNSENTTQANQSMLNYYMFAKGEYMVSDNLRVRATGVFDASPFKTGSRLSYSSLGVDYKIKDNFFISADFNIQNYAPENPMFRNPVHGFFDNSGIRPYGNSMFSEPFPSW